MAGTLAPDAHAPLAPSSASRWVNCPGSHLAEQAAPPGRPTAAATEGSRLHAITADCLSTGAPPPPADTSFDPVTTALALSRRIIAGRRVLLETRLRPLGGLPMLWGTADVLVFDGDGRLSGIADFKFGWWGVSPASLQLVVYGLLGAAMFGAAPEGVTCWVIQPSSQHPEGAARGAHYTPAQLAGSEAFIRHAAARALLPDQPKRAGEWCTFCRAAPTCEIRRQSRPRTVNNLFTSILGTDA